MATRARIAGIGVCVPQKVLTNKDLEKIVDTTDEWIRTRTGIRERRIFEPNSQQCAADLGAEAARNAMADAGISAADIDCIVCGTFTPDSVFPSTACDIQNRIGANNATAFDIMAACSGFVYGLAIADAQIQSGKHKNVLLVGTEIISRVLDWSDRNTCVLFGDGAGAAILTASDSESAILSTYTQTDGSLGSILSLSAWGAPRHLRMNGSEVFKHAVRRMGDAVLRVMDMAGLSNSDIDYLVPHQANTRIIKATANHIDLPMEKVFVDVDKFGNTSSASIPIALHDAKTKGIIKPGNVVVMVAFGGGLTWGAAAVRW